MSTETLPMTVEDFEAFVNLPQNADRLFEYIGGELVEVPSNPFASKISQIIAGELYIFLKQRNWGHLTGEAGGYMVFGERYAPDVGYISYEKQPELAQEGYNPNPPDLAVEVDFPSTYQSQKELRTKVVNYLAAGTTVWVVLPDSNEVEVYEPSQPKQLKTVEDHLDGGEALPGFILPVKTIFGE